MAGGVFRLRIDPRVFTCEFTLSTFVFYLVYKGGMACVYRITIKFLTSTMYYDILQTTPPYPIDIPL